MNLHGGFKKNSSKFREKSAENSQLRMLDTRQLGYIAQLTYYHDNNEYNGGFVLNTKTVICSYALHI